MSKNKDGKREAVRIREPIGLRVLVRGVRPEDGETCQLWRADLEVEAAELIERGEAEERAMLWAALLRWSEAEKVAAQLSAWGWSVTLHGVRMIALGRAVGELHPPSPRQGWLLEIAGVRLRGFVEQPAGDVEALNRLLAFLDEQ